MVHETTRKTTFILAALFISILAIGAMLKGDISVLLAILGVLFVYLLRAYKNKGNGKFSLFEKILIYIFLFLLSTLPILLFK